MKDKIFTASFVESDKINRINAGVKDAECCANCKAYRPHGMLNVRGRCPIVKLDGRYNLLSEYEVCRYFEMEAYERLHPNNRD